MYDDDSGYEMNDPKHPSFVERWLDHADTLRKRERENAVAPEPAEGEREDAA